MTEPKDRNRTIQASAGVKPRRGCLAGSLLGFLGKKVWVPDIEDAGPPHILFKRGSQAPLCRFN